MGITAKLLSTTLMTLISGGLFFSTDLSASQTSTAFNQLSIYLPGQLIIKRKVEAMSHRRSDGMHRIQAHTIQKFSTLKGLEVVVFDASIPMEEAIAIFEADPSIVYAEPNYLLQSEELTPNDEKFGKLWGLHNAGQDEGIEDMDINAPEAWKLTKGTKENVIAVIDTGILYTHPDLKDNMWVNELEIPDNGIDDDNNGYIDDIHGINAIDKNGDPKDDDGHGTHCAGTIAGVGDNEIGVIGVAPHTSLIGCKFLDGTGRGDTSTAIACLDYVAALASREEKPVNIISTNNSWGGSSHSKALYDAIKKHQELGILFFAAARNNGQDNDSARSYPTNYDLSNIISVAAVNRKGELADFSNYGKHSVDISAPGVDILSTFLEDDYKLLKGTSMATPHAVGLSALVKAHHPDFDWRAIKNTLIASGKNLDSLLGKTISGRMIRAFGEDGTGALTCKDQFVSAWLSPLAGEMTISVGQEIEFKALSINCEKPSTSMSAFNLTDDVSLVLKDDGKGTDQVAGDGIFSASFKPTDSGYHEFQLGDGKVLKINVYDSSQWQPYVFAQTDEPQWEEIEGTALKAADDTFHKVTAPFPIQFAGDKTGLQLLTISSNGFLSLTEGRELGYNNMTLPTALTESVIAPLWDDLTAGRSEEADVFYATVGTSPSQKFVVEWRNMELLSGGDNATFQVVFYEKSPEISFNYRDIDFGDEASTGGASATVGIQSKKENAALFSFNEAKLTNNMTLSATLAP